MKILYFWCPTKAFLATEFGIMDDQLRMAYLVFKMVPQCFFLLDQYFKRAPCSCSFEVALSPLPTFGGETVHPSTIHPRQGLCIGMAPSIYPKQCSSCQRPDHPPTSTHIHPGCWCRCKRISNICALFALSIYWTSPQLLYITRNLINKSNNPIVAATDLNLDEDIWCWGDCMVDGGASYVKSSFSCTSTQCANFAPAIWTPDPETFTTTF